MRSSIIVTSQQRIKFKSLSCNIHTSAYRCQTKELLTNNTSYSNNIKTICSSSFKRINIWYEKYFGIAEMKELQTQVLAAQSAFLESSHTRKNYQEQINNLNKSLRNIKEKLDTTSKSSSNYLSLVTDEHNLFREELKLEAELNRCKELEQKALDELSFSVRRSHERERIRQERAKFQQLLSYILSITVALISIYKYQQVDQKRLYECLDKLCNANDQIQLSQQSLCEQMMTNINQLKSLALQTNDSLKTELLKNLSRIEEKLPVSRAEKMKNDNIDDLKNRSWASWIMGYIWYKW